MANQPKIVDLIKQAQTLKARMNELKETCPEVMEYIKLDDDRSALHKEITGHIDQYNVNAEQYKKYGLVGRVYRNVKVGDIETLAQVKPKLASILLPLINESRSYYTK